MNSRDVVTLPFSGVTREQIAQVFLEGRLIEIRTEADTAREALYKIQDINAHFESRDHNFGGRKIVFSGWMEYRGQLVLADVEVTLPNGDGTIIFNYEVED